MLNLSLWEIISMVNIILSKIKYINRLIFKIICLDVYISLQGHNFSFFKSRARSSSAQLLFG